MVCEEGDMAENYEVIYIHPSGATATFIRQGGELDALAKGLDAEQFWIFKQVKALLVRNDPGDLAEANRLMASVGFAPQVRVIEAPQPAPSTAALREAAFAGAPAYAAPEAHAGPHMPSPSYWPLFTGMSITLAFVGILFWNSTFVVTGLGLLCVLICLINWGLEPLEQHH
jgi:hypothetical protein